MTPHEVSKEVEVTNGAGVHARVATLLAKKSKEFSSKVELMFDDQRVDCNDVLQVLALGAAPGQRLTVIATGEDAPRALDAIVEMFEQRFWEDEIDPNCDG
jgi:phosphocarrier protein NPr